MIFLSELPDLKKMEVMNKSFVIAKREYRAAVRTKAFLISLLLLPVFMGGGLIVLTLFKDKIDLTDKKVVVLDYSGLMGDHIIKTAESWNKNNIYNDKKEQISPLYFIEIVQPDTVNSLQQKLDLSNRIRHKEIHAFLQIGVDVVHPHYGEEQSRIFYFAENSAVDNVREWLSNVINNKIREMRVVELGVDPKKINDLFYRVGAESMGLLKVDSKSGQVIDAKEVNEMQAILIPYFLIFLMFMMLMMSAVPLLSSVMEEKSERVAEVLLGSVTPWQFMMGKIIGGLGVSLTTSTIYVLGAVITLRKMGMNDIIPYEVLPWFFAYMLLNIIMVGSIMAALGASCNDSKDAQAIQFPAMLPIILPLFFMMPIIMDPLGKLATGLSLFPLWTPMIMLLRQSTSVTIPTWQPIVGLIGVVLFTFFCVWAGARIFRSAIILQGKRPKIGTLFRYIIKG